MPKAEKPGGPKYWAQSQIVISYLYCHVKGAGFLKVLLAQNILNRHLSAQAGEKSPQMTVDFPKKAPPHPIN